MLIAIRVHQDIPMNSDDLEIVIEQGCRNAVVQAIMKCSFQLVLSSLHWTVCFDFILQDWMLQLLYLFYM